MRTGGPSAPGAPPAPIARAIMSAADVRRMYEEMRKMRWVRREMDRGRLVVPAFVSFFAYYVILTAQARPVERET